MEAKLGRFELTEDGDSQDRHWNWGGVVWGVGRMEESQEGPNVVKRGPGNMVREQNPFCFST